MEATNSQSKYCEGCKRTFLWKNFQKHLRYKKRNAICYAIWHKLPLPGSEPPPVEEAPPSSPEKRPADANGITETGSPPKTPRTDAGLSDDEPIPFGNSPNSEGVITHAEVKKTTRRKITRSSPIKTRSRRQAKNRRELFNNPTATPIEEDLVANDNRGDNTDDEGDDYPTLDEEEYPTYDPTHKRSDEIDTSMLDEFTEFCNYSYRNRLNLTDEMKAATQLMALLSQKRVPLNIYEAVFTWHLENLDAKQFVARDALVKYLRSRYNMEKSMPTKITNLRLPFSKARIDLVIHDAKYQIMSLLTDPRIKDDDYLFFNNNPFEGPPDEFEYVADINTGRAYRETYRQLIKDPSKQVLLPVIMYMDSAVTSQFSNLPIEALKFTLGIFNQKARDEGCFWRELGYLTQYVKANTRAEDLIMEAEHIDAKHYVKTSLLDEEDFADDNQQDYYGEGDNLEAKATSSCQDMHFMLRKILEPYKKLQDMGGIAWNLHYKGKNHNVHFIPFIMFVKGDTGEADKHCGKFGSRGEHVKQLCRYCTCPNEETDNPYKRYPRKSPQMIQPLVIKHEVEELRLMSQSCIQNCWYPLQFGLHNQLSIHGATPIEILHWLDIGKFGYNRENLSTQMGEKSKFGLAFDAVCASIGYLFARQSDQDLPRTQFAKGIKSGKLQGHEMSGLMLVVAAAFRTREGRSICRVYPDGEKKDLFTEERVNGWVELIERLLQFEAWLKLKKLPVEEVKLAEIKIREIMQLEKEIGKREKGMGYRLWNFHASSHVAEDILDFGVPTVVNTASNEMHHKPGKTAALRTQRRASLFDMQCAEQLASMMAMEVGMMEIEFGRKVWQYFDRKADPVETLPVEIDDDNEENNNQYDPLTGELLYAAPTTKGKNGSKLTGTKVEFWLDEQENPHYKVKSRMNDRKRFKYHADFVDALKGVVLGELWNLFHMNGFDMYTEYKRKGHIFRASPYYMGKPWMDWAIIDWDDGKLLPGQIWGFIDFTELPDNEHRPPGIYAMVESCTQVKTPKEANQSRLFVPYKKDITVNEDNITRKFWLADVDSIHSPTVLIPDIGNEDDTALLRLKPREEWAEDFSKWLKTAPKKRNFPTVL